MFKTSLTIEFLINLILITVLNKKNKINEGDINKTNKNRLNLKNIRNLARFKSLKTSTKYKKLIMSLVKFKISKKPNFLSSSTRVAYT